MQNIQNFECILFLGVIPGVFHRLFSANTENLIGFPDPLLKINGNAKSNKVVILGAKIVLRIWARYADLEIIQLFRLPYQGKSLSTKIPYLGKYSQFWNLVRPELFTSR